jgi:hypothetical protein
MKSNRSLFNCKWIFSILTVAFLMLGLSQSSMALDAQDYPLGDIPLDESTYQLFMKPIPEDRIDALPSKYDARSDGIVSPAKDQGACGSCWAFASVGAVESKLKKEYNVGLEDLSEEQQVRCNTDMYGCGGGSADAILYWETNGPISESCYPYTATEGSCNYSCTEKDYRVTNYYTVPRTATGFKQSLYDDGPSYWRYEVYSDFGNFWNQGSPGQVYRNVSNSYSEGGHAVLIIGWDDAKGAFLCKNSWGTNGGPNNDGTFWIAYSGHAHDLGFGMANFNLTTGGGGGDWPFCFKDPEYTTTLELIIEGNQIRGQAKNPAAPDNFPAPITGFIHGGYAYFAINYLGEDEGFRFYAIQAGSKTGESWAIDDAGNFYDTPRTAELVSCDQGSEPFEEKDMTGALDGHSGVISHTTEGNWNLCFYDSEWPSESLQFNVENGGVLRGQNTYYPAPLTGKVFNGNAFFAIGYPNDNIRMYAVSGGSLSGLGWAIRDEDSTYYDDPHSVTLFPCEKSAPEVQYDQNDFSKDSSKSK